LTSVACPRVSALAGINNKQRQDAFKNDVSHVLGDYTFVVAGPFYRRTIFVSEAQEGSASHAKYGYFSSVSVGTDLDQMLDYSLIESSAIDSMFITREVGCIKTDDGVIVTEVFAERPMLVKLTNWLAYSFKTGTLNRERNPVWEI
jgi:hypothetical protein